MIAATERRARGDTGEQVAVQYLKQKGFRIIERNYQRPWGEIDIVAMCRGVIRFIEVKTISREKGKPLPGLSAEDNVHPRKIERLSRITETYMDESGRDVDYQIDLVTVELDYATRKAHCTLYEQIL